MEEAIKAARAQGRAEMIEKARRTVEAYASGACTAANTGSTHAYFKTAAQNRIAAEAADRILERLEAAEGWSFDEREP